MRGGWCSPLPPSHLHHSEGRKKKRRRSSVHMVTTSYAAEVVSPLSKSQPQLKKKRTKIHLKITAGYSDLAKK